MTTVDISIRTIGMTVCVYVFNSWYCKEIWISVIMTMRMTMCTYSEVFNYCIGSGYS